MSDLPPVNLDAGSVAEVLPKGLSAEQLYRELKAIATAYLAREDAGHTLQPTALVHEALVRLAHENSRNATGSTSSLWANGREFLRLAIVAMQRVLIEHSRRKKAARRGGAGASGHAAVARSRLPLEMLHDRPAGSDARGDEFEQLERVLDRFEAVDPRAATVVRFRFFGGLSGPETARALGISPSTVESDWRIARAWIGRAMGWTAA
ncbi:MAG: ECF-type sigma factor [Planctomycetota bacterium]|nr:ECF-type sigma factor [Planctomycetota bacterium]